MAATSVLLPCQSICRTTSSNLRRSTSALVESASVVEAAMTTNDFLFTAKWEGITGKCCVDMNDGACGAARRSMHLLRLAAHARTARCDGIDVKDGCPDEWWHAASGESMVGKYLASARSPKSAYTPTRFQKRGDTTGVILVAKPLLLKHSCVK